VIVKGGKQKKMYGLPIVLECDFVIGMCRMVFQIVHIVFQKSTTIYAEYCFRLHIILKSTRLYRMLPKYVLVLQILESRGSKVTGKHKN
jgi:hypothetical protein